MFLRSTMNDSPCIAYEIIAPNTAMLSSVPPMIARALRRIACTTNHRIIMVAKPSTVPAIQRHVRHLLRVGQRHERQVVAGARQRIDLPAIGIDDGVEARDEPDDREERQRLGGAAAVQHAEAIEQRLTRSRSENAPCILPSSSEPTLEFRKVMSSADTISVNMPRIRPLGMSFFGSADSSAASGNCSMARNSHTANGSVTSTPFTPNGNQEPPPSGSSTLRAIGADADVQRPAIEVDRRNRADPVHREDQRAPPTVTSTETRNDSSTPNRLSSRNTT